MNCPKCKSEHITAKIPMLQFFTNVYQYYMECRNCKHIWRYEESAWTRRTDAESAEWANVMLIAHGR